MKFKNNPKVVYMLILILSALFLLLGFLLFRPAGPALYSDEYHTAIVASVGDIIEEDSGYDGTEAGERNQTVYFQATLTSGGRDLKGTTVEAQQYINYALSVAPKPVEEGDKILLYRSGQDPSQGAGQGVWQYAEKNRMGALLFIIGLFLFLILLIGGRKGFSTIVALIFTVGAIFLVYIPSILKGFNIYAGTVIICGFIIVMSLLLLNGINRKTLCAILGNTSGVLISGLLALIFSQILGITGDVEEDYLMLLHLSGGIRIDLTAIVWGSVLIGSLGAIMDVAMSIASALQELAENMEKRSFWRLFRSGMNIGRDAIGTMTNTLILAYIGGSMATVLLLMVYNMNPLYLFNLEMIVVEVLQAVVGSIGILLAVPATAFFASYLYTRKEPDHEH